MAAVASVSSAPAATAPVHERQQQVLRAGIRGGDLERRQHLALRLRRGADGQVALREVAMRGRLVHGPGGQRGAEPPGRGVRGA
jgi:hypothetical protein